MSRTLAAFCSLEVGQRPECFAYPDNSLSDLNDRFVSFRSKQDIANILTNCILFLIVEMEIHDNID